MINRIQQITDAFYESVIPTNLFNAVIISIMLYTFWGSSAQEPSILWGIGLSMVLLYRQILSFRYFSIRPENCLKWLRSLQLAVFFSGLLWGILALTIYPSDVPGGEFFIIVIFVGMSATAAVTYAMSRLAFFLFIGPVQLSLSVRLLIYPAYSLSNIWWLVLVYMVFLFIINANSHARFMKTLNLQLEKDQLIQELQAAKQETESAFETMEAVAEEARVIARRAQSADKAKSDFLANISHEIRTPLNHVIGLTNLVLESDLDSENREYLHTVIQSSRSLLEMVNNIIEYSRMETTEDITSRQLVSLRTLVDEVLISRQHMLVDKQLKIQTVIGEEIPTVVKVDANKLKLVLSSLVENAIKFTNEGSIHIQANVSEKNDDHMVILFSVQDTGKGIPAKYHEKIFESFYQIDASSTRKHGGTGIGLALARGLTGFLGGSIWVESQEGIGSSFYFTANVWPGSLEEVDEE